MESIQQLSKHKKLNKHLIVKKKKAKSKGSFKTKICKFWKDGKTCMNKDKCQFAHGPEELRYQQVNKKRKKNKKKCSNFHGKGFCSFGQCCYFQHDQFAPTMVKRLRHQEAYQFIEKIYLKDFFMTYQKRLNILQQQFAIANGNLTLTFSNLSHIKPDRLDAFKIFMKMEV